MDAVNPRAGRTAMGVVCIFNFRGKQAGRQLMKKDLRYLLFFLALLWGIHILNFVLPWDLRLFGIIPRTIKGLWGIPFSHFIHGDFSHLISNSVPLMVLGLTFIVFYKEHLLYVFLLIIFTEGCLLWLLGRSGVHLGASGLVFGLIAYLIVFGFLRKKFLSIALALIVSSYYGGTLLFGILPIQRFVSWEGHLFGVLGGVVAAYLTRGEELR